MIKLYTPYRADNVRVVLPDLEIFLDAHAHNFWRGVRVFQPVIGGDNRFTGCKYFCLLALKTQSH